MNHGERVVKVFLYGPRRGFVWEDARLRRGGGQQEWYRTLRGSDDRRSPRLMSTAGSPRRPSKDEIKG